MVQSSDDKGLKSKSTPVRATRGLTGKPVPTARAAAGLNRRLPALKAPNAVERFDVKDHRGMAVAFRKIAERMAADPEFSVMFAVNPVLTLERYGIHLTPDMQDHVLRAFRHPPRLKTRRQELEAKLTEALGAPPRVDDPAWLAGVLFEQLAICPLETEGAQPIYRPPLNAEVLERLKPVRPKGAPRYPGPRRIKVKSSIGMKPWKEAVRRLDLAAAAPSLPAAGQRPKTATLEEAWFYKDAHPLARDLVELGQIQRMAFPVRTPDAFRQIAEGKQPNAFRSWIKQIRFKAPAKDGQP
jgi:hypothetical protein